MTQPAKPAPSDPLAEAIAAAVAANRIAADGRAVRRDGWTPERMRLFLETLANCGSVAGAARAVGVSARAAYKFRDRAPAFDDAWVIALDMARPIRPFVSRVLHGSVEIIHRDGVVREERHYFDNRLAMATLTRLDRRILSRDAKNDPVLATDFDSLVERACAEAASRRGAQSPGNSPLRELNVARRQEDRDTQPCGSDMATAAAEPSRAGAHAIARGMRHFRELKGWMPRAAARSGPCRLGTEPALCRETQRIAP